ncbi:6343_t:CDS:2, partial [Cetraspora pellucida]
MNKEKLVLNIEDKSFEEYASSLSSDCKEFKKLKISETRTKQDLVNHLVGEKKVLSGSKYAGTSVTLSGSANISFSEPVASLDSSSAERWLNERSLIRMLWVVHSEELSRQVALKRAYIVTVANEDVAAKMASSNYDPMAELFGSRKEKARMAVQHFLFAKNRRPKVLQNQNSMQPALSTLIQPQPFVQLLWQQPLFQAMDQLVLQDTLSCNGVCSPQLQIGHR